MGAGPRGRGVFGKRGLGVTGHAGPRSLCGASRLRLAATAAAGRGPAINRGPLPARPARPVVLPPLIGATPTQIRERVGRMLVVFACDDSGSMYGTWGDPTGIRYAAALSLVGLMERSGGGRAAVVHWGTEAPIGLALTPVRVRQGRRALRRALTVPPTLGGNDLPLALERCRLVTPGATPDEHVVHFVLTDGIEPVTAAVHAAVAALPPGSVHMLLVDRSGGCGAGMEADWRSVAFGSFTRLQTFETAAMSRQLAEIFAGSMGLSMPAARARRTGAP